MDDKDYFNAMLDEIIGNRAKDFMMSDCVDEESKKHLNIIDTIAKRHNLSFMEMYNIVLELAVLTHTEE